MRGGGIRRGGRASAACAVVITAVLGGLTLAPAQAVVSGRSTLDQTLLGPDPRSGPFAQLSEGGPAEAQTTLEDLAQAQSGRERRRTSLSYFGQLSDYQLADEESPARVEFVDPLASAVSSAFRPQEALVPHEVDQSIRQMNSFMQSPVAQGDGTKAQMSHTILTGDLADSQQLNETEWVRTLLDGGRLDPNSGTGQLAGTLCAGLAPGDLDNPANYTGVQDYDDYNPDSRAFYDPDQPALYDRGQFPSYQGLLDQAQKPFDTPGLMAPSYVALGNHDGLVQGNQAASAPIERVATGCLKITGLPPFMRSASTRDAAAAIARRGLVDGLPPFDKALRSLDRPRTSAAAVALPGTALVPPDARRQYVDTQQYKSVFQGGAQADGHGFDLVDPAENQASNDSAAYYSFSPKPGLRFISVDSVSAGGVTPASSEGNVDDPQFRWLTGELEEATRRNELIVVFAHHSIESQSSNVPDEAGGPCTANDTHGHDVNPGCDRDPRSSLPIHLGEDFRDLLLRFPKVVAFVAGHSHENKVQSYKSAGGDSGFWEIKSPAVADWPTQSRLIEVMDNKDGTLSIFGTLLDFAAPAGNPAPGTRADAFSTEQLASIGRTITFNDPQVGPGTAAAPGPEGRRTDRNVELLLGDPRATAATTQPNDAGGGGSDDGNDPNDGNEGNEGGNPSGEGAGTAAGGDLPFTGLPLLALAVLGLLLAVGGGLARRRAR